MRVLIVDDNQVMADQLAHSMREGGFEALTLVGSDEAIATIEGSATYDLVLVEGAAAGLDGIDLCRRIRQSTRGHEVPLILIGGADVADVARALACGADDVVSRPLRPHDLVSRARGLLEVRCTQANERFGAGRAEAQRAVLTRMLEQHAELSSLIVHDLKSPIASQAIALQNLLPEVGLTEAGRESLEAALTANCMLHRMVLSLLDAFHSLSLRPKLQRLDIATLVENAVEVIAPRARRRQVSVVRQLISKDIDADPSLLGRVLDNLLDNALRHAPARSEIRVGVEAASSEVVFRVTDAGAGISGDPSRVFEPFVRLEPESRSGHGLGLASCRAIVAAHRGRIWVASEVGKGTEFAFSLPMGQLA